MIAHTPGRMCGDGRRVAHLRRGERMARRVAGGRSGSADRPWWRRLAGRAPRGSGLMQLGGDLRLAGPLGRAVEALPDPLWIAVLNTALAVAVLWAGGFWEPLR